MQSKKSKISVEVQILTDKTSMRFIPTNFLKPPAQPKLPATTKKASKSKFFLSEIVSPLKSFRSEIVGGAKNLSSIEEKQEDSQILIEQQKIIPNYKLKFLCKLSSEHILIGNEFQLDLISILGINANNFVQTQFLQSIKFKNNIHLVSADNKKFNLLTIVAGQTLYVYKYDSKKFGEQKLSVFKEIQLPQVPKFLQIVKDGNVCVFYDKKAQIFLIGEHTRSRYDKKYKVPETVIKQNTKYTIFMVPDSYDNILNIFFEQQSEDSKIFTLWCVQLEFLSSQIKTGEPQKIYDIKKGLKKTLSIKNYSKQLFLLNLGCQVLALKKGYILDSATVNLKQQQSCLQYIGNNTLLHISQSKIDVYNFQIKMNYKPYRINIKPRDSIKISQNEKSDQFFKIINVLTNDFMFVFQKGSNNSFSKSGEIIYSFYVTRSVSRENKMKQLFYKNLGEQFKIDDLALLEKCDMAEKMGFTKREIYLQLWSKSKQSRTQDYCILIATKDYRTIQDQTVRKLKKSSMSFKQIQNIEDACFKMLDQRVFSPSCTQQAVMDYISSHFFRRKLEMFKDLHVMERFQRQENKQPQQSKQYRMTIRQYQQYKSMEIKAELLSLVNQFCHEKKKYVIKNIRLLFRNFKFVFRTIYYQVLDEIVVNSKDCLLELLKAIPELLPYTPPQIQASLHIPTGFYDGVWTEINRQQWNTSLYIDAITTIDNKEIIFEKVIKNINFKRGWLSQHDMTVWSVQKINQNFKKIKSSQTFYFFLAKIFEYIKDQEVLIKIVEQMQNTYQMPENIQGNVFLMEKLYRYFVRKNIVPEKDNRPLSLSQFFSFHDKQFIRHCFEKERSNKGLLLKDIKDIYKDVFQQEASERYNQHILNYFISDLSELSDLKYILNRINNQKLQFHEENQSLYDILIQALSRKLKIGTQQDIPIQQVLIYIENIPLKFVNPHQNRFVQELKDVKNIEKQSWMLREAKINMSIYDILRDSQTVLKKLINHIINTADAQVFQEGNEEKFKEFSIKKLAMLENFGQEIYVKDNDNYAKIVIQKTIFLQFLSKLCESQEKIKFAKFLILDQNFQDRIDYTTVEGLVLYMEKWKLTEETKIYIQAQPYIQQLLTLLSPQSSVYQYVKCQFEFARILSPQKNPVAYPFTQKSPISSSDIRQLIFDIPVEFLLKVDVEKLYNAVRTMQNIYCEDLSQNEDDHEYLSICRTSLHQIYQMFIIKFLQSKKLKEVLPYIKKILQIQISSQRHNIVYVILFAVAISQQLNQSTRNSLFESIWFNYNEPKKVLEVLEYIFKNPLSTKQTKQYLQDFLFRSKQMYLGYNEENALFNQICFTNPKQTNFFKILQKSYQNLRKSKEEFKNIKYHAMMIMLCNEPYALAKYISCSFVYDNHIKCLRSFLSYIMRDDAFLPLDILEFGRRIFLILFEHIKNQEAVETIIERYQQVVFSQQFLFNVETPTDKTSYQFLMWKSSQAFKKKKAALQYESRILADPVSKETSVKIRSSLGKAQGEKGKEDEVIHNQSQNQDQNEQSGGKRKKVIKEVPKFNASEQFKNLINQNKHKLFLSTRGQQKSKGNFDMAGSTRFPFVSMSANAKKMNMSTKNYRSTPIQMQIEKQHQKYLKFHEPISDENEFEHGKSSCQSDQEKKLQALHSPLQSIQKISADSSPELILHHKRSDEINERNYMCESEQLNQDEQMHKQRSRSRFSDQSVKYAIKVQQVEDPDDFQQKQYHFQMPIKVQKYKIEGEQVQESEIMIESTEFVNPVSGIIKKLLQSNREAIQSPFGTFDLTVLEEYARDKFVLIDVIKQLYEHECNNKVNLSRTMHLIQQIVQRYSRCQLNRSLFSLIVKAQQAQTKIIPEINFSYLISPQTLTIQYQSKKQVFQVLYSKLYSYIDSENIYKISQFIRRVFDDEPEFQQWVIWDFVLDLGEKLQWSEKQELQWNVEKILASLPKVKLSIWNQKFESFRTKILGSTLKQKLLQIFCGYLAQFKGESSAIQFLQALRALQEDNIIIQETLAEIK